MEFTVQVKAVDCGQYGVRFDAYVDNRYIGSHSTKRLAVNAAKRQIETLRSNHFDLIDKQAVEAAWAKVR